jgi:hypothetical protein
MRERHDLGHDAGDLAVAPDGRAIGNNVRCLTLPDQEHRHHCSFMQGVFYKARV